MRITRFAAAAVAVASLALVLTGCSASPSEIVEGSSISVAWDQPFYSYNSDTVFGHATANSNITYATNSQFNFYDDTSTLQKDTSFGTYEKISDNPLVVKYTIADGVTWSDGTAVDAADLLLNWVSLSGAYNTPGFDPSRATDAPTGELAPAIPAGVVYFDSSTSATPGLGLVTELPRVSDDKKSITMTWDKPFGDWELAFTNAGLPAHVVAEKALGIEDPQKAKDALVKAITENDTSSMAKIANFWNTGFNFTGMPSDPSLVVSNGPYTITDVIADRSVTLTANENYVGKHKPKFATVRVTFIADPHAAIQALHTGEVQVISPAATADVASTLAGLDLTVLNGVGSTYEHIDLQFDRSKSGYFSNPLIREAFLKVIPRQEIVDRLIVPIQPDATTLDSQVFLPSANGYADSVAGNGSADYAGVDIAGARALLAEAAVTSPEVCILFSSTNPRRAKEFLLIQQSAALAGFTVTDCSVPDAANVLGTAGAYDASLFGWQSSGPGAISGELSTFNSTGANNLNYYSNPRMDELTIALGAESDPAKRIQIEKKMDKLLWEDAYGVTLFQLPSVTAFDQSKVAKILPSALLPTVFWNIWEWSPVNSR